MPKVLQIAERAGEAILAVYNSPDIGVSFKVGGSPLTEADIRANTVIHEGLSTLGPFFPVLSEESGEVLYEERASWKTLWIVDPLDGTKEFIGRNGEFTVNIALVRDGEPVLGVVYAPVTDTVYYAAKGFGAFKITAGNPAHRIETANFKEGKLKVVVSRTHGDDDLGGFLSRDWECEVVKMGSSLKFCLVAEGGAHIYLRRGPTMEWDTAAAHCVVSEAGGGVIDFEGRTLLYNKEDLLNPGFIVCGKGDLLRNLFPGDNRLQTIINQENKT